MLAAQRAYTAIVAVLLVAASFFFVIRENAAAVVEKLANPPSTKPAKPTFRETMTTLFGSIKHDMSEPGYIDPSGTYFKSGDKTTWTKPLGKKVLIIDIDTRVPTGENQILNPERLDWEHLKAEGEGLVSNGIMNHYLYALIHGYDYKFYQARDMKDHYNTWILPHVLREMIDDYQFVIAMDADVTISHLEVPFEWLFNRWGITEQTSVALPWDTEEFRGGKSISTDSQGLRVLNTGLVIAQNSPTTLELIDAWRDCTSEARYPGCARWKYEWSHEQRAFSEYIRYDFNRTQETIISIPCDDAMGWPGFRQDMRSAHLRDDDVSDCNGTFFRHHTTIGKSHVKNSNAVGVMQALSEVLQKDLLGNQATTWYKEPEKNAQKAKNVQQDDGTVVLVEVE